MIASHRGVNRATLHDIAVNGGQPHDVLTVFGHVHHKLAAIIVEVGNFKMMVRFRTTSCSTSHDIVRNRGQRRRATSSMIVQHRTAVIRSPYDITEVARPSRDFNL